MAACKEGFLQVIHWCWNDENNTFPPVRILFLVGACFFYVGDIIVDSVTASEHYQAWREGNGEALNYFIASIVFILCPSIIVNALSFALYTWGYIVYRNEKLRASYSSICEKSSKYVSPILWHKRGEVAENANQRQMLFNDTSIELQPLEEVITQEPHDHQLKETSHPISPQRSVNSRRSENGDLSSNSLGVVKPEVHRNSENLQDVSEDIDLAPEFYPLDLLFTYEYIIVLFLHILQVGLLFRALRLIYRRKIDRYSFDRYRDISFLRLMECFLESAPQLFLQLYIIVLEEIPDLSRKVWTGVTVVFSMISLAFAVGDYISAGKDILYYDPPPNRARKPRLSWRAYILIVCWQLAMIFSRSVAVALFASEYGYNTFIMAGAHYLIMLYWMYRQEPELVKKELTDYNGPPKYRRWEKLYGNYGLEFLAAAFNLFFLFKLRVEDSLLYTTTYYTLFFIENVLMIGLWYVHVDYTLNLWYLESSVVAVVMSFVLGLGMMMLYYLYLQPKDREDLPLDPNHRHPLMTCTLNRLYRQKIEQRKSLCSYM